MSVTVVPSRHRASPLRDGGAVSPELVLVDPELAASARPRLPEPPDSLARAPRVPVRSPTIFRTDAFIAVTTAALDADEEPPSRIARHWSQSWRFVAGVATVTIVTLLLLDVRVEVGKAPASAERTVSGKSSTSQLGGRRSAPGGGKPPASSYGSRPERAAVPRARHFAWAPERSTSAYHVELFHGSTRVFAKDTTAPEITIPARWSFAGKRRWLQPGEYRWYVWPVVSGQRRSKAIVQAKLVVPAS